jgi:hypothetical protein
MNWVGVRAQGMRTLIAVNFTSSTIRCVSYNAVGKYVCILLSNNTVHTMHYPQQRTTVPVNMKPVLDELKGELNIQSIIAGDDGPIVFGRQACVLVCARVHMTHSARARR